MIASAVKFAVTKGMKGLGFSESTAKKVGWAFYGVTVLGTLDVLSIGAEAAIAAGGEAVGAFIPEAGEFVTAALTVTDVAAAADAIAPIALVTDVGYSATKLIAKNFEPDFCGNILLFSADPSKETKLRVDREFREIEQSIRKSRLRDRFVLHSHLAARPQDLTHALLEGDADIVHFSGHGTEAGCLCFENDRGETVTVPAEAIGGVFAQLRRRVRCVVLNACFSIKQAKAILNHVDFVIGMKAEIGDKAAIAFSTGFYQAIGSGYPIEQAFELGKSMIQFSQKDQHLIPVLLTSRLN